MKRAVFIVVAMFALNVHAAPLQFNSGDRQTVMVELYTSEGCSSCPSAEEFLNAFTDNAKLWKRYIPLAWHVDYWDYLGWPDRFARPGHARRQREYARVNHSPTVYTPAFFVNGHSWRPGLLRQPPDPVTPSVGNLGIRVNGSRVEAVFDGHQREPAGLHVHVALVGLGLHTRIKAGENAGRSARHDFVLLDQIELKPSGPGRWLGQMPAPGKDDARRYALVAWVDRPGSPAPIQATGGYLQLP